MHIMWTDWWVEMVKLFMANGSAFGLASISAACYNGWVVTSGGVLVQLKGIVEYSIVR